MILFNLLLVLFVPFVLGVIALSLFNPQNSLNFFEKKALAFLTGIGLLTILMFLLSYCHIPLTFFTIVFCALALSVCFGWHLFRRKKFLFCLNEVKAAFCVKPQNFSLFEYSLLFLILLKVVYVFFEALIKPVIDVDAISMYTAGAKAVFFDKTIFTPFFLSVLHDKPLFAYLSQAWVFIGLGRTDDCLVKIFSPAMFICLLVVFYSVLRRDYPRKACLFFTFLLSTLPFMVFHASTAYSDFPQAVYYSLGAIYFYLFIRSVEKASVDQSVPFLTLSAFLLGISVWIKRGGVFLAGAVALVLLGYLFMKWGFSSREKWRKLLSPLILFLFLLLPWFLSNQLQFVGGNLSGVAGGISSFPAGGAEGSDLGVVANIFGRKLFLYADWHLLWLIFLLAIIFCYKRIASSPLKYLLLVLILNLAAMFVQFGFTPSYQYLLDGTLLDRLVMSTVPLALFFCAEAILPDFGSFGDIIRKE